MEQFDFVVIGNEPAGIWLLSELYKSCRGRLRFGWMKFSSEGTKVLSTRSPLAHFGVEVGSSFQWTCVTPKRTIEWNWETIREVFPGLPEQMQGPKGFENYLRMSSSSLSAIRYAIGKNPEILSFANAIWKRIGRTDQISPENLVAGSLLTTDLCYWDPVDSIPNGIETVSIDPDSLHRVELLRKNQCLFEFHGAPAILSGQWVINTNLSRLSQLRRCSPILRELIDIDPNLAGPYALYPLDIQIDATGIPSVTPPLFSILDTELLPEPIHEMWPIELIKTSEQTLLRGWAGAPWTTSPEIVQASFGEMVARLNRLFPFLSKGTKSIYPPLFFDPHGQESIREGMDQYLDRMRLESYRLITLLTQTRLASMECLLPSSRCHLPYPLGSLFTARDLATRLLKRWRKRLAKEAPSPVP